MDRRTYLAGVTAGSSALFAGCSAVLGDGEPSADETNGPGDDPDAYDVPGVLDTPTVVDFETARLTASVVGGGVHVDDRLSGRIGFVEPATPEGPARLVASLRNDASFAETVYAERIPFLDSPTTGRTREYDTMYLAPTAESDLVAAAPEATRDETGRWRLVEVGSDWFPEAVTLDPGESIELVYRLLGHHDADRAPIEAGRYRFGHGDASFSIAVWPTGEPGPTDPSTHVGVDVPRLPTRGDESTKRATRWFHEATSESAVYLEPDVESIELPGRVEFDFVNRARELATGNPYYWRLYKLVDERWYPVYPWGWNTPLSSVPPGDVDETALHCYHENALPTADGRTVGHLGGGRYAYTVDYSVDNEWHAALFDVEAEPITVDVADDATVADEGDRLVVTLPNHADAREPTAVTVNPTGSAGERVIPEQLVRRPFRAFRNALPLFEPGVERVEVRTDRATGLGPVGYETDGTRTISYDGRVYEATGDEID
ncbi:hypothetical protein [Halovivax cerinus]|uniref:Uncharacterized protein n=1 Tax=Halovivax cerinus TaxID=1487865 RepID=A0ABD5NTM5_9EURY|nr:hypothetical protein [Halovivax cerinus]